MSLVKMTFNNQIPYLYQKLQNPATCKGVENKLQRKEKLPLPNTEKETISALFLLNRLI